MLVRVVRVEPPPGSKFAVVFGRADGRTVYVVIDAQEGLDLAARLEAEGRELNVFVSVAPGRRPRLIAGLCPGRTDLICRSVSPRRGNLLKHVSIVAAGGVGVAERTVYRILPADGGWKVTKEDARIKRFHWKSQAIDHAVHRASTELPSQLVVHLEDGQIEEERTYGDR